jgi:hypothetical protein
MRTNDIYISALNEHGGIIASSWVDKTDGLNEIELGEVTGKGTLKTIEIEDHQGKIFAYPNYETSFDPEAFLCYLSITFSENIGPHCNYLSLDQYIANKRLGRYDGRPSTERNLSGC